MTRRLFPFLALLGVVGTVLPAVAASPQQPAATTALVKELTDLLQAQKLDTVAAKLDGDTFAAALYIPGNELLALSAKYTAPAFLNEKILGRQFKDAYADLSTTQAPETKVLIEDVKADGIRAQPAKGEAADVITRGAGAPFLLDGKWKDRKIAEDVYAKTFQDAETSYRKILEALIAELKKTH
jgi:hypothetical protein